MKIEYLKIAKLDVFEIQSNLSRFYPTTPGKFLKTLKKSIETLSDNPLLYPVYEFNPAYRKMLVLDYLVFYKVFEERQAIEVHRILYAKRNIKEILEGPPAGPKEDE